MLANLGLMKPVPFSRTLSTKPPMTLTSLPLYQPKPQQLAHPLPLQRSSSGSHHYLHSQPPHRLLASYGVRHAPPNFNSLFRRGSRRLRCHVHQYDRSYEVRTVLCPSCRQPFFATAMPTPPPITERDMYYCSWGFFPMGFPGDPAFAGPANSPMQQPPASLGFYPMGPYLPLPAQAGVVEGNVAGGGGVDSEAAVSATVTAAVPVAPLPAKSTHVKVGARKRGRPKGSKNKNEVIEIN